MSWAHFHLVINHFPIVGIIIASLLLLVGKIFTIKGYITSGLSVVVFTAFTAVIAFLTGDSAEQAISGWPDVAKGLISRHEDMAAIGMYILIPAGVIAALTLYSVWKKEKSVRFLTLLTLVLAIVSSLAMAFVGYTGGQIRHSEFRSESSKQYMMDHDVDK